MVEVNSREEKNRKLEENLRKEEASDKRKIIEKKIIKIAGSIILIITLFFMYMHFIGTKGLIVKEYKVESNKLPNGMNGLKVVHFSDLKYLSTTKDSEVKDLVTKINYIEPDIIVFTGDLIGNGKKPTDENIKFLIKQLNKLKAKIGLYAVKGDKDYKKIYNKVMGETNFKIINNSYELIYYKDNIPILLTGSGSILKDDCDLGETFSYDNMDNIYTISLIHEPDTASTINSRYKTDLILAGHNLNGKIRIPGMGGLMKLNEGKKYLNSKYDLGNSLLFVSSGLGTEKSELRLFNHPSINFYRIVKKAN